MATLLQSIMRHIEDGDWRPSPVTTFSAANPSEPFRYMAQARHIGKVAVQITRDVQVLPAADAPLFSAAASYLITGGLGGIALKLAEWMAQNGAGHLALVSRRAVSEDAAQLIRRIEAAGTSVQVIRADITRQSELAQALSTIRETGAPLKGIMHTAAVMDVALLRDLSPAQLHSVMAPKVEGTWNLHEATFQEKLDFFVLFSSAGAIHPQPGMGNYAAANAFLDAFAHYRRAHGMVATSINWGIWGELGLTRAAAVSRGFDDSIDAYVMQGFKKFSAEEGLRMLGAAMRRDVVHAVAVPFDWTRLAEFYGADQAPPLYADFVSRTATAAASRAQRAEALDLLSRRGEPGRVRRPGRRREAARGLSRHRAAAAQPSRRPRVRSRARRGAGDGLGTGRVGSRRADASRRPTPPSGSGSRTTSSCG